ncbi:MAG: DUF3108 domain-containing protein [Polaromonas sp.]
MSALLVRQSATAPGAASPRAGPRPRTLGLLLIAVLMAHALVLRTAPTNFGPRLDPSSRRAAAFVTRSIRPPPAPAAGTPALAAPGPPTPKPAAKPAPKPARKLVSKENSPLVQQSSAPAAIEFVAPTEPETTPAAALASEEAALPSEPDSTPASGAETVVTAATDAASAAPAQAGSAATAGALPELPPGPRQTVVTAIKLPESARLDYKVTGGARGLNYHASAVLNWQNTGSDYEASMTVSALFIGSRSMASKGQIISEGLAPGRFADKYKSEVAAHFEPDKGQVSFSANTPTVPWIKGMQDRVSVFFQLAGMLAGNPEGFPVGSTISMVTVGPRDADGWTFVVEAAEKLGLPFGELDTLRLSRQPRKEFDQKVEIWYAPSLGYLPVRSRITQSNGDFVDQQLTAVGKPGS